MNNYERRFDHVANFQILLEQILPGFSYNKHSLASLGVHFIKFRMYSF